MKSKTSKIIFITCIVFLLITSFSCKKQSGLNNLDFNSDSTTALTNNQEDSINAGFQLTQYDTPPIPIKNPMPLYPVKFKKSGIQGVVVLEVEVLQDGTVGEVKVLKSLLAKESGLDDTAVNAVKSWIFKPALLKKKPVTVKVNIPIPFTLKS